MFPRSIAPRSGRVCGSVLPLCESGSSFPLVTPVRPTLSRRVRYLGDIGSGTCLTLEGVRRLLGATPLAGDVPVRTNEGALSVKLVKGYLTANH